MYPLTSPITKLNCEHIYSVDEDTAGCSCRTEKVWDGPQPKAGLQGGGLEKEAAGKRLPSN